MHIKNWKSEYFIVYLVCSQDNQVLVITGKLHLPHLSRINAQLTVWFHLLSPILYRHLKHISWFNFGASLLQAKSFNSPYSPYTLMCIVSYGCMLVLVNFLDCYKIYYTHHRDSFRYPWANISLWKNHSKSNIYWVHTFRSFPLSVPINNTVWLWYGIAVTANSIPSSCSKMALLCRDFFPRYGWNLNPGDMDVGQKFAVIGGNPGSYQQHKQNKLTFSLLHIYC